MSDEIDNAIAELTGITGNGSGGTVWVYGEYKGASEHVTKFEASRGRRTMFVEIMNRQVKRYRDGETSLFLIEMPSVMAKVLGLEEFVLDDAELERLRRYVDTSRPW